MKQYLSILLCASLTASSCFSIGEALSQSATKQVSLPKKSKQLLQIQGIAINTADAKTLSRIKGIGPKKARAIIQFREKNGEFNQVADLEHVPGINKKILHKLLGNDANPLNAAKSKKKHKRHTSKRKTKHRFASKPTSINMD